MHRIRRLFLILLTGLALLLVAAVAVSALSNRNLPSEPERLDRLTSLDKARLAEALQLKQERGEAIWPGWGKTEIPVLLWNRGYSFLIGHSAPPAAWEAVPDDRFVGQIYYRRPTADPQNFAVQVGNSWVASMATKWETDSFLMEMFQEILPGPLEPIFPYRLLIQPSEVQITGVLHESFHVYQARVAPTRLDAAEAVRAVEAAYWTADAAMHDDWARECDLLDRALQARSQQEAAELARQFLTQRQQRRQAHSLEPALIDYERQIEWEEGLAKYLELAAWRQADMASNYEAVPAIDADPDFKGYHTFEGRWSQEIGQMKRQASRDGETRFYYTGMAQATLLDRFRPGWKTAILQDGAWLEAMLAEAVDVTNHVKGTQR